MNKGEKRTTQKIPLMGANGGLNNREIILRGMMIFKKRIVGHLKRTNERYELKQLPTYNMQLLEYNLMENNVEGIYNVYLQHHPIKVNI
jgi:hypothetical protein